MTQHPRGRRRPKINQTKLTATAPRLDRPGATVETFLMVYTDSFGKASAEQIENVQTTLRTVTRARGGDPEAIVWTAQPVGPQARLVTSEGRRL